MLNELGFGTRAYNPAAMRGLASAVKAQDQRFDAVIITGGLLPERPHLTGHGGIVTKKRYSQVKNFLSHSAKTDYVNLARQELSGLSRAVGKSVPIYYVMGEEDAANIKTLAKNRMLSEADVFDSYVSDLSGILDSLKIMPYSENTIRVGGVSMNVAHNHHASSSQLLKSGLGARMKRRSIGPTVDIDIEGHHGGGLRVQPVAKGRESSQDITYYVQLPTFQDESLLDAARRKYSLNNVHTKRLDYMPQRANGATIMELDKGQGVASVEFIDSSSLKYGAMSASKSKKKELKIEVISDVHIGAPNPPGVVSNYELVDAAIKYQERTGLPDAVIVGGDILHGSLPHGQDNRVYADVPAKIQKEVEKIQKSRRLSKSEKLKQIEQTYRKASYAMPLTNISKQKEEVKKRLIPYWEKVLENGGDLVLVSGNHYNKSLNMKDDEARNIATMLPEKYEAQIHVIDGGNYGVGQSRVKNALDLYAIHKTCKGPDIPGGLMNHINKSGVSVDLAVSGHYHQPGMGHANGTLFVCAPSMQPMGDYADSIGATASLRGIMNVYMKPGAGGAKARSTRTEFVLDKALLKYV